MFDDAKFTQSQVIAAEVRAFLQAEPIPGRSRKFNFESYGAETGHHAEKYRNALSVAMKQCNQLMRRLKPLTGVFKDGPLLIQRLLERKNGLVREYQRFQVDLLSPAEKEIFASDVTVLQTSDRFGKKTKPSRRPPERVPEHLKKG